MDVITAVITAKRRIQMTSITEETGAATATATAQPKATQKARAGARSAHVAPRKGRSGKKAKARFSSLDSRFPAKPNRHLGGVERELVSCF